MSWLDPITPMVEKATNSAIGGVGKSIGDTIGKFAPLLALPVAYGLLNKPKPPVGTMGGGFMPPMTNYIQPNLITPPPMGFKYSGVLSNTAYSTQNRVVSNLVDNMMHKNRVEIIKQDKKDNKPSTDIQGKDYNTKQLLADPQNKEYIKNLLEN